MYNQDVLFFAISHGRVLIPADAYRLDQVLNAMVDCERVFKLPVLGVINSRAIFALRGKAEPTRIVEPGLALRAEAVPAQARL